MNQEEIKNLSAGLFNIEDPEIEDLGNIIIKQTELVSENDYIMFVKITSEALIGTIIASYQGRPVLFLETGLINTGDIYLPCDYIDAIAMADESTSLLISAYSVKIK